MDADQGRDVAEDWVTGLPSEGECIGQPLSPLEVEDDDDDELNTTAVEHSIKVAMDSGAGMHVMNPKEVPGINVVESEGSRRGKGFVAACGSRIVNQGEMSMAMSIEGSKRPVRSTFQAADVTRALFSVSQICDNGCEVHFTKEKGIVTKNGRTIATFPRRGGLYVGEVTVRSPPGRAAKSGFTRQGVKR